MFCSECKKEIADDSRFCKFCGSAIEAKDPEDIDLKDPAPIEVEDPAVEEMFKKHVDNSGISFITKILGALFILLSPAQWPNAIFHGQRKEGKRIYPDVQYFNAVLKLSSEPTNWLRFYVNIYLGIEVIVCFITCVSDIYQANNIFLIHVIISAFIIYTYLELIKMSPQGYVFNIIYLSLVMVIPVLNSDMGEVVFNCLFAIPTLIYFTKRKNLFYDKELHKAALGKTV